MCSHYICQPYEHIFPTCYTHPLLLHFLLPSFLTYFELYLYMQPTFHSIPLSISLQGRGYTALIRASERGHAEAIKALLTAPGIDVNHAEVSLCLLTPLDIVVGVGLLHIYLPFPFTLIPAMMTYLPPTWNMYPSNVKKIQSVRVFFCLSVTTFLLVLTITPRVHRTNL